MVEVLITAIASFLSAFVTWIFARRRQNVDIQTTQIDNLHKIAEEWKQAALEWKEYADAQMQKFIVADAERENFRKKLSEAMDELEIVRKELGKLRRALTAAENKVGTLFDTNKNQNELSGS